MRGRSDNTAFQFYRNSPEMKRAVDMIPDADIDILITHGPPKVGNVGRLSGGCELLRFVVFMD